MLGMAWVGGAAGAKHAAWLAERSQDGDSDDSIERVKGRMRSVHTPNATRAW